MTAATSGTLISLCMACITSVDFCSEPATLRVAVDRFYCMLIKCINKIIALLSLKLVKTRLETSFKFHS